MKALTLFFFWACLDSYFINIPVIHFAIILNVDIDNIHQRSFFSVLTSEESLGISVCFSGLNNVPGGQ